MPFDSGNQIVKSKLESTRENQSLRTSMVDEDGWTFYHQQCFNN
jgi:hypothetical protein